jgi:hypothetical protein
VHFPDCRLIDGSMEERTCREHQNYWQSPSKDKDMQSAFSLRCLLKGLRFKIQQIPSKTNDKPINRHFHLKGHLFRLGITNSPICGRCHMETKAASRILCVCVALAELRFCSSDKHFMESSNYDEIPLCKIQYFISSMELLAE